MPNLLSVQEVDVTSFNELCNSAEAYRTGVPETTPIDTTQQGGLLFFESSTRTRIGFGTAAWQLGVRTVSIYETKVNENMSAAESLPDTIRTLNPYVTFFCIRHPNEGVFDEVVPYTSHPVINAGNGSREHPTQALIDGYTLQHRFGRLEGLSITMLGALRYSRAARSLLKLLAKFNGVNVTGFTEPQLNFTEAEVAAFTKNGNTYQATDNHAWGSEQVVYSAGFPPVTPAGKFSQEVRNRYAITLRTVNRMNEGAIILNPLPRIDEVSKEVDDTPQAHYFAQNELGLFMRKAILARYALKP